MKQLLGIIFLALLLIGCGAETAVQDTAANLSARGGDTIVVNVDNVWTDMRPLANTNRANAIFRLEIVEDAAKLGSDEPIIIYGGGTVVINHEEQYFTLNEELLQARGRGRMTVCADDKPQENGLFYPCGLPIISLTAQIDGVFAEPVEADIFGTAVSANAKEDPLEFPGMSVADRSELSEVSCMGRLIPNSNVAQIIMIGELKGGETVRGGGLLHLGNDFTAPAKEMGIFQCELDGTAMHSTVEGKLPTDELNMEHIMFETLTLNFENGETIQRQTVSGFLLC